jgi:hypothetical protein
MELTTMCRFDFRLGLANSLGPAKRDALKMKKLFIYENLANLTEKTAN